MKSLIRWMTLWFALVLPLSAQEPPELERKVAVKLISLTNEIREDPITIVSILKGKKREEGFVADEVRRVTAIHPVPEGGKLVRRVCHYDFYWSEPFGWFYAEKRDGRGGDEMWTWSEKQGWLVLK